MSTAAIQRPNKLRAGNSARRVFGGRGCGGLGKFGPGLHPVARLRLLDLGSEGAPGGQCEGVSASSHSITSFQSLSEFSRLTVAWRPSHGVAGLAVFCGAEVPCRLIASLWTGLGRLADPAQLYAADTAPGGGASPLSTRAPGPYGPSGRGAGNLASSAANPCLLSALRFGSASPFRPGARNISRWPKGSGVWVALIAQGSGAETRGILRLEVRRVGVNRGAHVSLDLGRAATLGGRL